MSQCNCLPYQDGGPCDSCCQEHEIHDLKNALMSKTAALDVAVEELETIRHIASSMAKCPASKRTAKAPIITLESLADTAAYALKTIRKIHVKARENQ